MLNKKQAQEALRLGMDAGEYETLIKFEKEAQKMASLKEEALGYEPQQTKNIADLEVVSTNLEVDEQTAVGQDGKEFTYKFITVDGEKYRVPNSVISSLKAILEENPKLAKFKVKKSGSGLQTEYTVIPLL